MSYTPKNAAIYIQALTGAVVGMRAFGSFLTDATAADYVGAAQSADAYAQTLDLQWAALVGTTPTNFELSAILNVTSAIWSNRSPLISTLSKSPGSYVGPAQGVIALVIEANAQIVAQGVDPNTSIYGGGGGSGITQLTGAVTAGPGSGSQVATLVLDAGATVTGALPAGNQASQTMGGDATGTTAATTIIKINGTSVPAGGALTPGNVLTVSGASAATWQAAAGGGLTAPVTGTTVTKTTNYTLDAGGSDFAVWADTTGGAWTLTLPAPTTGRIFLVIDSKGNFGTAALTIAPHGAELINGLNVNKVLSGPWARYWIVSDGTNWVVQG